MTRKSKIEDIKDGEMVTVIKKGVTLYLNVIDLKGLSKKQIKEALDAQTDAAYVTITFEK